MVRSNATFLIPTGHSSSPLWTGSIIPHQKIIFWVLELKMRQKIIKKARHKLGPTFRNLQITESVNIWPERTFVCLQQAHRTTTTNSSSQLMEGGDLTSQDNDNNKKGKAESVPVLDEGYKELPVYKGYKN